MVLKFIVILFGILTLTRAFIQLRRDEFTPIQFVFWMFVWGIAAFFVFFPSASSYLADFIGVGRGADALIYLSIMILFYGVYRIYIKLEKIERSFTKLIRHEALKHLKKKK
jgi:small membrane protein